MNAARRNHIRRNWPRGLYESKPGYYVWRSKLTGKTFAIGSVTLAAAKAEANAANAHEDDAAPKLLARVTGAAHTIGDVLDDMKDPASAPNTVKARKSLDGIIRAAIGDKQCASLTVAHCADLIEKIEDKGKGRSAEAVRGRLIQVCRRGMQLGWLAFNPAEVTREPSVTVKRGRLTMESFRAIYAKAPEVNGWLQRAMMFGLVLGADRITLAGLQRSNVAGGLLTYTRQKTHATIAVPLALRLEAVGVSLDDLVSQRGTILSPYLIHHVRSQGRAKVGAPVHPDTLSQAFTDARELAGIPDEAAPTFHELRSLCKREYDKQGNVDTKALLGHAGERVSDLYADSRGAEPILVKVG
ncbi:MAG TPA: phage integrase Arm DNA-binding domain-containing protein [Burkholderiaceae bacterium]|nr:phage integrase Arm DNA-binding domain-containing protein [Burkholderiaceae bacterium]